MVFSKFFLKQKRFVADIDGKKITMFTFLSFGLSQILSEVETNIFVVDDDAVLLITQELEQQLVIFPEKRGIKQLGSVIHYVEQVSDTLRNETKNKQTSQATLPDNKVTSQRFPTSPWRKICMRG